MATVSLQQVVRAGFAQLRATYGLRNAVIGWAYAVMGCRTAALGGHVWRCPEGHEELVVWNSCKHRACSQCSGLERGRWLDRMRRLLALDCGYHHVVFTVPHELTELWQWNRSWFAEQVLGASRQTLLQLLGQPRWLGALPGIVLSWQTWGRNLIVHPHVHALVTAGGWTGSGWKALKHDYLLPTVVLRAVFRGQLRTRLLAGLSSGELVLPAGQSAMDIRRLLKTLYRKEWCVHVQPRYRHGQGVLMYLARYVRGGPLRQHQILALTQTHVTFRYTDHHDQRMKSMRLPLADFLFRLSEHVPEPGFRVVRYAGIYASGQRAVLAQVRQVLGMAPAEPAPSYLTAQDYLERLGHGDQMTCSVCKRRYVQQDKIDCSGRPPPFREYRRAA